MKELQKKIGCKFRIPEIIISEYILSAHNLSYPDAVILIDFFNNI
jgi:hypothetical protein